MEDVDRIQRIEKTMLKIFNESNLDVVTEAMARKQASQELGLNLSEAPFKALVRQITKVFIQQKNQQLQEEEEQKQLLKQKDRVSNDKKVYDDCGNILICQLRKKRKVTINEFKRRTFVSIRKYFYKKGKELPTRRGIHLNVEQWSAFKESLPAIEEAIEKLKLRI